MSGWIKLHRKLLDSLIFSSEKGLKIWIWCLLKANHKETSFFLGRQKVNLKQGQFIMGSLKAKEELELAVATIWYWLNILESEGLAVIKKTNKYSIITIQNWTKYQEVENRLNTDGTQIETYNNDKNDNNIYSNSNELPHTPLNELTYEPLKGMKSPKAFANRARAKVGKPPLLKKDPSTWAIVELYQKQYRYITGKTPKISDADYFHVLKITKLVSPEEMEKMVIWYVKMDNRKFKDHPNLRSIFTEENINKFNLNN